MSSSKKNQLVSLLEERFIWFIFLMLLSLVACDSENNKEYTGIIGTIENLPQLSEPYEYAIWLEESENVRLVQSFNADDDGVFRLATTTSPHIIEGTTEMYVTIENSSVSYEDPSDKSIVAALFTSTDFASFKSFPIAGDFSATSGTMQVKMNGGEFNEIDFMNGAALSLPTLKSGWTYELWSRSSAEPYEYKTIKRFISPSENETYLSSEDLLNKTVLLSVELIEDDSAKPSGIFILEGEVTAGDTTIEMLYTSEYLPAGTVEKKTK